MSDDVDDDDGQGNDKSDVSSSSNGKKTRCQYDNYNDNDCEEAEDEGYSKRGGRGVFLLFYVILRNEEI